ncbi:MAG: hypothetical protein CM15mP51_09690 [Porticoccaceae bacterium]|nr:MAG: hypothetical protein CM15mP51_09690 [Porticoccaceae bacterium]
MKFNDDASHLTVLVDYYDRDRIKPRKMRGGDRRS